MTTAEKHIVDLFVETYYPKWPDLFHEEHGTWVIGTRTWNRLLAHIKQFGWKRANGPDGGDQMFGRPIRIDESVDPDSIRYVTEERE